MSSLQTLSRCVAALAIGATIPAGLSQIGNFDSLNSYAAPIEAGFAAQLSIVDDALEIGGSPNGLAFGLSTHSFESDAVPGRFRWKSDWDDLRVGYARASGDFRFGALVSFLDGSSDSDEINPGVPDPATGRVDSDGWQGAAFFGYVTGSWSFDLIGSRGQVDHDMDRSSDLGPTFGRSFSAYETKSSFYALSAAYEHALPDSRALSPFVRIGYGKVRADGFVEMGGPDRRIVDAFDSKRRFAEVGATFDTGPAWYAPELSLSYRHESSADDVTLEVSAANGVYLGSLVVPHASGSAVRGGVAFGGEFAPGWLARLRVDYEKGGDIKLFSLSARIAWQF